MSGPEGQETPWRTGENTSEVHRWMEEDEPQLAVLAYVKDGAIGLAGRLTGMLESTLRHMPSLEITGVTRAELAWSPGRTWTLIDVQLVRKEGTSTERLLQELTAWITLQAQDITMEEL